MEASTSNGTSLVKSSAALKELRITQKSNQASVIQILMIVKAYELDCLNEDNSTIKVWMIILNVNVNKGF